MDSLTTPRSLIQEDSDIKVFLRRSFNALAIAALAGLAETPASAGPIVYTVSVDTSSLNAASGFLDFQFNPGSGATQSSIAQVLNFTGGTLGATFPNTGNVSGTLPGTLTFVNSTALNEYFQAFTFGLNYSFLLTLSGPAVDSPNGTSTAGSTFGIGVYNSSQNPMLTNQSAGTGFAGEVDLNLNGTATSTAFPNASSGPSVVTLTPVAVPEPNSLLLLSFGLALLAAMKRS
jgi:hypothetical protein